MRALAGSCPRFTPLGVTKMELRILRGGAAASQWGPPKFIRGEERFSALIERRVPRCALAPGILSRVRRKPPARRQPPNSFGGGALKRSGKRPALEQCALALATSNLAFITNKLRHFDE